LLQNNSRNQQQFNSNVPFLIEQEMTFAMPRQQPPEDLGNNRQNSDSLSGHLFFALLTWTLKRFNPAVAM